MNNESITIEPKELRNTSMEMRRNVGMMKDALDVSSTVMDSTRDSFDASSADEIRAQYNVLKTKFNSFYEKMTSYADFLDRTAGKYEKADSDIKAAASDVLDVNG